MASTSASYYTFLHLPKPIHFHDISSSPTCARRHLALLNSNAKAVSAARFGPKRRASARPLAYEREEEELQWSGEQSGFGDDEKQQRAGGNGAAHGEQDGDEPEDYGAAEGDDMSGWTQRPRPRELFVCNLPRRCGVDMLLELFRPYGTVLSVEVSRDAETGISRGCGFVTMRSVAEARTAINALDGFDLDGREMFVKLASDIVTSRRNLNLSHTPPMKDHIFESPYKIYVGNLAWSVQPRHLREFFAQCGTVVSTRLLTDRKGGKCRVYGFLSFSSTEEMEAALRLDNTEFHGRNIIVRAAHVKVQDALSP